MIISTAGSSISINALHASAAPFDIPEILIFVASTLLKVFNKLISSFRYCMSGAVLVSSTIFQLLARPVGPTLM